MSAAQPSGVSAAPKAWNGPSTTIGVARERGHQPHGAVGIAPTIGTVHLPGAVREQAQIADRGGLDVADHRLVAAELVERRHQRRDRGGRWDVIDRDERRGCQHRGRIAGRSGRVG
ncbi:MAG: hypothetical protein ACK4E5_00800 [Erythrobacter cryptus]